MLCCTSWAQYCDTAQQHLWPCASPRSHRVTQKGLCRCQGTATAGWTPGWGEVCAPHPWLVCNNPWERQEKHRSINHGQSHVQVDGTRQRLWGQRWPWWHRAHGEHWLSQLSQLRFGTRPLPAAPARGKRSAGASRLHRPSPMAARAANYRAEHETRKPASGIGAEIGRAHI